MLKSFYEKNKPFFFQYESEHVMNRVMTLDRRKNLVFAQYLKNEWTEFN